MTSGQYITWFIPVMLIIFTIWEFVQLARRRAGNKSAYTMSQYVVRQAKAGHEGWKWFVLAFPIFIAIVGLVLILHWQAPCIHWDILCEIGF